MFVWTSPFALYGGNSADFHTFYLAGRSWLSGGNPYNDRMVSGFIYPPPSLPFFSLFSLFDFRLASQLWIVTYFTVFLVALVALALTLRGDRRLMYASLASLIFFTSYPLLIMFQQGQIDLLIASLTILSLVCERKKHNSISAAMLSISVLLKGNAILLLIYFVIFRRDWKYLVHFLIITLAIVGLSLIIIPVQLYWDYAAVTLRLSSIGFVYNESIPGQLAFAQLNAIAPIVSIAGYGLFTVFSYWASSKRFSTMHKTLSADGMFLMNVLIMLLFGPRSTIYPYVWVILPVALFLSTLLMEEVRTAFLAAMGIGTFLLSAVISPDFLNYKTFGLGLIGNVLMTISLILLYVRPNSVFRRITKG